MPPFICHHDVSMRLGAKIEVKENSGSKVMEDACLKFTNRYSEDGAQQWVKDYTKDLLLWSFRATKRLHPSMDSMARYVSPGVW